MFCCFLLKYAGKKQSLVVNSYVTMYLVTIKAINLFVDGKSK